MTETSMTKQELLDKVDRLETTLREVTVGYMTEPADVALSKVRAAARTRLVDEARIANAPVAR